MTQHYHQTRENIYTPWGKIPMIQPSCLEKDLDFIQPEKKHLFLEHISRETTKRLSPNKQNKLQLQKFLSFFQHFCPKQLPQPHKNDLPWHKPEKPQSHASLFGEKYENSLLDEVITLLQPWRKGPFFFYNRKIHSEWQSQKKWQRLEKALDAVPLKQGNVLDIGSNNAYYLFRFLCKKKADVQKVIGIEPVHTYFLQYLFLMRIFAPILPHLDKIHYFPVGYQDIPSFFQPNFSLILCMGILYHHPHPLQIIEIVKNTLQSGGWAIFEVQGVEKSLPFSLFPEKTYAQKKGFWFLPTLDALKAWLLRCGFKKTIAIDSCPLTTQEQQTNKDCPFASLGQGLNPEKNQTLEGYPPPYRHLVIAQK